MSPLIHRRTMNGLAWTRCWCSARLSATSLVAAVACNSALGAGCCAAPVPDEAELNAPYVPPMGPEMAVPGLRPYTRGENLAEQASRRPTIVAQISFGIKAPLTLQTVFVLIMHSG